MDLQSRGINYHVRKSESVCLCVYVCIASLVGVIFFFFFGVMGNETASRDTGCVSMLKC